MAEAPAGIVGKFAAHRPLLAIAILAVGLMALSIAGVRQAPPGAAALMLEFAWTALFVLALPWVMAALLPQQTFQRIVFGLVIAIAGAGLIAADLGALSLPSVLPAALKAPPYPLTAAALAFAVYMMVLAPMASNAARLTIAAPLSAILGATGGAGYLAIENLWGTGEGAAAAALALALAIGAGVTAGANFTKFFSAGARHKQACAAAGHGAVSTIAFSMLVVAAYFAVQTFNTNFGAIEWNILWAGFTISATAMLAALVGVTGALSMMDISEAAAVYENRRRQWFASAWRPMRFLLPPTTAIAAAAIIGVIVVIAIFEAGFAAPLSLLLFFLGVWVAAVIAFVSLRTSFLIVTLLGASAVLSGYLFAVLSIDLPGLQARLAALALSAAAISYITVSWRDAGETWRNARDVTENALSDGLRRFLFAVGASAASLFVAAQSLAWADGIAALVYFLTLAFFNLALAPVLMTAMSAQFSRY